MIRVILGFLIAAFLITGCGGGGGGDTDTTAATNLKVTSIQQPEGAADAGHTISLQYTVNSESAVSDVITSFYIMNKSDFDALDDIDLRSDIEQYYIGSDTIEYVSTGDNISTVEFQLPQDMDSGGEYFIVANVDPDGLISENNEDDNEYTTLDTDTRAASFNLDVSLANKDVTNLVLKNFELQDTTIVLDLEDYDAASIPALVLTEEYPNFGRAQIKGSAVIEVDGPPLTVEQLNTIKFAAQVYMGGTWHDVNYWDNDNGNFAQYVNLRIVDVTETLDSDEEEDRSISEYIVDVDINIPVATALAMVTNIIGVAPSSGDFTGNNTELINTYNTFGIRIILDPDNSFTETTKEDNTYEQYVKVYTLPGTTVRVSSSSPYVLEKEYKKGIGKKSRVKAQLEMYTRTGFETQTKYGVIEKSEISMPIYAFKHSVELFGISDQHSAYVNSPGDTGYANSITFMNSVIYSDEQWADSITISFERSWAKERKFASATFTIGPVPITVATGAEGQIGMMLSGTLNTSNPILESNNNLPDMDFDLYATAGVGGGGFSAGPAISMTIIKDILNFYASASLTLDGSDNLDTGTISAKIRNDMEAIRGKFGVYVKYRTLKWCKKWGIPYPCGTRKKKKYKWFYKTRALYDKKRTLYNKSKTWNF